MNDLLSAAVNAHAGCRRVRSTDPLAGAQIAVGVGILILKTPSTDPDESGIPASASCL